MESIIKELKDKQEKIYDLRDHMDSIISIYKELEDCYISENNEDMEKIYFVVKHRLITLGNQLDSLS